jgi:hypothetical protein
VIEVAAPRVTVGSPLAKKVINLELDRGGMDLDFDDY